MILICQYLPKFPVKESFILQILGALQKNPQYFLFPGESSL